MKTLIPSAVHHDGKLIPASVHNKDSREVPEAAVKALERVHGPRAKWSEKLPDPPEEKPAPKPKAEPKPAPEKPPES